MANYILLERVELNASAASVTFDNIPQSGYTDLKVVASGRGTRSEVQSNWLVSFNGSTTNFTARFLEGTGSGASSGSYARFIGAVPAANATASTFGNLELYIPNYLSNVYKSYSTDAVTENNATLAFTNLIAGLWSDTSAINSITISSGSSDNFVANSTFSLYGVADVNTEPVIAPKATGGNIVTNDGTYWIHTFTSSGTFTPLQGLSCDYLVVAGGGGAGGGIGGAGGAGGLRSTVTATGGGGSLETALTLNLSTNYTVTVGSGGAGGNNTTRGVSGSNSVFSTITSTGGGGGGAGQSTDTQDDGLTGGSGGGQGAFGSASAENAAGTANQGFQGGSGAVGGNAGGGGGASAVGVNSTTTVAGNGGAGVATSISSSWW
jgi:hypothetical protein